MKNMSSRILIGFCMALLVSWAAAQQPAAAAPKATGEVPKKSFWYKLFSLAQANKSPSAATPSPSQGEGRSEVSAKIEEIVVTAQKRSENLQNVPLSAQVISSQTLTEENHNSL